MRRGLSTAVVMAMLSAACASSDGAATPTGPTAPSPTPAPTAPAPTPPATASCPPAAPRDLQVTLTGSSTRTFTWSGVANAYDYFILIGSASGQSDLVNTNTTQTTYQWTGAARGTY